MAAVIVREESDWSLIGITLIIMLSNVCQLLFAYLFNLLDYTLGSIKVISLFLHE